MSSIDARLPALLRQLRQQRGWSLRRLANLVPCSHVHIHQIEEGRSRPSPELLDRLDAVLAARGALSHLLMYEASPADAQAGDPWETAELIGRMRSGDVSPATIDALHTTVGELCCAYGWRAADHLRTEGQRWLRETERLLHRQVGLRAHQELLTAAGWLALLVGCVEYDLGLRPAAEATRGAAAQLATEAGNAEILAWAWEMAAWFALTQGRYRDTVAAADAGQRAIGDHTAAVQLIGQQAKALARAGDTAGVRDALARGRRLLDRFPAPARPDHHFVVDPDKWDFYAMDAYRLVGEDELAAHHARHVIELGTAADGTEQAPMRMAEARLTLGTVAARAGELEAAVEVATAAFQARRRSLPTLRMVAAEVGTELDRRDPGGRPAAEFREALREVVAG